MDYLEFVKRNSGFIKEELQEKIQHSTVLIAGCGIGSSIAEALLRIGFINQILVDADTVAPHNLNRQIYTNADIGKSKAMALSNRLKSIYPAANLEIITDGLSNENVKYLVSKSDLIVDSIDFLSLPAIVSLHDECCLQQKPIISTVSAGWGAVGIYFPAEKKEYALFRELFGLPKQGSVEGISYVTQFKKFIEKMKQAFPEEVIRVVASALTIMEDGTPCPASQLSVGAWSVAALAVTMAVRIINKEYVTPAPHMITFNLMDIIQAKGINLLD